ncbi:MAG: class I SAM-dependent methyltransferase [Cytophagales bacterium]|nr:class I SAM-dependent methyltransferase [Cytophagales bacterium]
MSVSATEVTSSELTSDNPLHQRLLFPYKIAKDHIYGDLLEIGCGDGRGVEELLSIGHDTASSQGITPPVSEEKGVEHPENLREAPGAMRSVIKSYTGIDKNKDLINVLSQQYKDAKFVAQNIPPLTNIEDNSFDSVISFQVIEHIKNDELYVEEIYRALKPRGKAIITTLNINMSMTRNPWHIREYTEEGLQNLFKSRFNKLVVKGVYGNEKVMNYYYKNKKTVARFKKFDILNLEYLLPRFMLQVPYDLLNRLNRRLLLKKNNNLVTDINYTDYYLDGASESCLDFFCVVEK